MRKLLAVLAAILAWWLTCAGYGAWSRTWENQKLADALILLIAGFSFFAAWLAFKLVGGKRNGY